MEKYNMNDKFPLSWNAAVAMDKSIINIYEVNSGYQDHKDFPRVFNEIMKLITDKFTLLKGKLISHISSNPIDINYEIAFIAYNESDNIFYPKIPIRKNIEVSFISISPQKSSLINNIVVSGKTYLQDKTFNIEIGLNDKKTCDDVLDDIKTIEYVISHELVHIFQNLYNNYKKTEAYYKKAFKNSNSPDSLFGNTKYWTSRYEIQAYITQINTELRQIKKETPDIKFSAALMKTKGWKHVNEHLDKNEQYRTIKSILGNIVNYWQHNLGGKINEFKIKLK